MRALTILLALVSLPALAAGLNDTGIQFCGDDPSGNSPDCSPPAPPGRTASTAATRWPRPGC